MAVSAAGYGSFHCRIVRDLSRQREVSADIFSQKFYERCDIHLGASGQPVQDEHRMECPKGGFGNDSARFVGFTRHLTHLFHTVKIPVRQSIGHAPLARIDTRTRRIAASLMNRQRSNTDVGSGVATATCWSAIEMKSSSR